MPKVTFTNTNQSVEVEEGQELRKVTQENGWPIPYGCENGICGTCLVKAKGELNEPTETEQQTLKAMGKADGEHRLACQCKIKGDVTIEQ